LTHADAKRREAAAVSKEMTIEQHEASLAKHVELNGAEDLLGKTLSQVAETVQRLREKYGDSAVLQHQEQCPGDPPDLELEIKP
jgi:hypothetical protein